MLHISRQCSSKKWMQPQNWYRFKCSWTTCRCLKTASMGNGWTKNWSRESTQSIKLIKLSISSLLLDNDPIYYWGSGCLTLCVLYFLDGMIDCSDSECCSHPVCAEHIMCLSSNDPVDVLLRKQPPSVTASFHQRVKFLIEENSVQSYAHKDEYSERWVN